MRSLLIALLAISIFITGCTAKPEPVSASGIPTSTPFQPVSGNASDSLYTGSAPTPIFLPTETPTPTPIPTVTLPPTFTPTPVVINPLTGAPVSDPALLNRRPMAIKIANYPRYIRPQSGLTLADHVFEYYIEGGLTRFIGVFWGNDSEWVGPVRSGRFFDENIQRMYQAFLVFKFADPRVLDYFKTTDFADYLVVPSFGECPPFPLLEERKIEVYNNSYFNTVKWKDCIEKNKLKNNRPIIQGGIFNDAFPAKFDLVATRVYTYFSEYSYHYWQFSPEDKQYIRYQESDDMHDKPEKYAPLVDRMTNQTVHASNVVLILGYHTFGNNFEEEDEVYHIDLSDSGEAYVFRDGVGIVAQWHRLSKNAPLVVTTPDGAPIDLKPGITFYEVIGTNSYVSQGDGEWYFHHATP